MASPFSFSLVTDARRRWSSDRFGFIPRDSWVQLTRPAIYRKGQGVIMPVAEPKRLMHWTCRKCRRQWQTEIQDAGNNAPRRPDAHEKTLCDPCMDAMGPKTK